MLCGSSAIVNLLFVVATIVCRSFMIGPCSVLQF